MAAQKVKSEKQARKEVDSHRVALGTWIVSCMRPRAFCMHAATLRAELELDHAIPRMRHHQWVTPACTHD
jgi:hypothetical protein